MKHRVSRILIPAGLLLILFTPAVSAQDHTELLRKVDALASYTDSDFSAKYIIVQDKPGQGRTTTESAVFRRDADDMYVIVIMKPDINKGQGYLKKGPTLWFYDPESRCFNSTRSSERFQNSNARNSDFTRSTLAQDYDVITGERVRLGRFDCWLLTLEANTDEVTYPRMKIWISDDGLVRKTEDYSLSGQLLRTSAFPSYTRVGEKYVPARILFIDELKGSMIDGEFIHEKTHITIRKPSFEDVPDSVFSKTFLENVNR